MRRAHLVRVVTTVLGVAWLASPAPRAAAPVFFPDDPIAVDVDSQDASKVAESGISGSYDFLENTFLEPGDRTPRRAMNVNTIDEVPDSSWFINRAGRRVLTADEVGRGPDASAGPAPGPWTVVSGKSDGITPGFTVRDTAGVLWFIKFDPPSYPEMATGAEMVTTKLFWALGYHVPENHIATLRRDGLVIAPTATMRDPLGSRRALTPADVDLLLTKGARRADGSFRVIASRALEGKPVGPYRYYGTRPDDPNDLFPHEHHRELRGLRAFSAWLNHDDSRSINSLDTLVQRNGKTVVWHHLIDFGSTLGSGSIYAQKPRAGNEYIWETRPTLMTALTLGLYVRPWIRVPYPNYPSLGNVESTFFDAQRWRPEYPNAAFDAARPDDLFWAARLVASISDDAIRAAVGSAEFSDAEAVRYLTNVIIERRNKVAKAWMSAVVPIVDPALDEASMLTFRNIAADTGYGPDASSYRAQFARFDNTTGTAAPRGAPVTASARRLQAPAEALTGEFVQVDVAAVEAAHPAWLVPVRLHFRRAGGGWRLVGINRSSDPAPEGAHR